jgi:excisionase family DNA binding protein
MPTVAPLLLSVTESATALGIGTTKTKALIAAGLLRSVQIDRRRLVPVDALHEYVDSLSGDAS